MSNPVSTRRADGNITEVITSPNFTRNRISSPSLSLDEVNIPPPLNPTAQFTYNYYEVNERVKQTKGTDSKGNVLPLDKLPRYTTLTWETPSLSEFHVNINANLAPSPTRTIRDNINKLIAVDEFLNAGYISHGFTSADEIVQGTVDVENYAKLLGYNSPSVFEMIMNQVERITLSGSQGSNALIGGFAHAYTELSNFPILSLGLRVYDEKGRPAEKEKGLGTVVESTKLHIQVNNLVIPDVFENSQDKSKWENLTTLKNSYTSALTTGGTREGIGISPVYNDFSKSSTNISSPCKIIGFTIERWRITNTGNTREGIYTVEDPLTRSWVDTKVLYGEKYLYAIRSVASVQLLMYSLDGSTVDSPIIYVSSNPVTVRSENFEFTPPPPPDEIRFTFNHVERNVILTWGTPVNPARDIVGFQIFRRKNIREPFELIKQYSWDSSHTGEGGRRYSTNERIDPNYIDEMNPDDRYLVKRSETPTYIHVDNDFTVDTEFYVSSDYIYALCSVDAHGIISNYSSQSRVTFDPYKNRLISQIVCDAGSPKQYPNMNLRTDTFIDTIHFEGNDSRLINLNFTPEYIRVRDEKGVVHKVVTKDSYYVLQMINLDNQKTQLLKIKLDDPRNLTSL